MQKPDLSNSPQLDKKLAAYALAGAAALVLPSVAHATPVVTVVNQTVNGTDAGATYDFNLTGSNSDEITIDAALNQDFGFILNTISASTNAGALVVGTTSSPTDDVTPLNFGDTIGSSSTFISSGKMASVKTSDGSSLASWPIDDSAAYLGFSFQDLGSNTHYGWAEIQTQAGETSDSFTVVQYAYESDPNTSITAGAGAVPEPSSIALLGLGAAGLLALRRRRAGNA